MVLREKGREKVKGKWRAKGSGDGGGRLADCYNRSR